MLRADLLRKARTYELLITRHGLSLVTDGRKPKLECEIVFRGIHGRLELDLNGKDKAQAGGVGPTFYSLAGEESVIPEKFLALVRAATRGANCSGCTHMHYVRKPRPLGPPTLNSSAKHGLLALKFPRRGELFIRMAKEGSTVSGLMIRLQPQCLWLCSTECRSRFCVTNSATHALSPAGGRGIRKSAMQSH
jgi:hypothetical protein